MSMSAFVLACSVAAFIPSPPSVTPPAPSPAPSVGAANERAAACPVCGKAIASGQGSKILVRGNEYTVDDAACGEELAANPDKYLNADGTPKNAKKDSKKSPK